MLFQYPIILVLVPLRNHVNRIEIFGTARRCTHLKVDYFGKPSKNNPNPKAGTARRPNRPTARQPDSLTDQATNYRIGQFYKKKSASTKVSLHQFRGNLCIIFTISKGSD